MALTRAWYASHLVEQVRAHLSRHHDCSEDSFEAGINFEARQQYEREKSCPTFNYFLETSHPRQQTPTPTRLEVRSSTSEVRKRVTHGSKKSWFCPARDFILLCSRYRSKPSASRYSIADLKIERTVYTASHQYCNGSVCVLRNNNAASS